ncbi:MAG: hypothetical protein VYD87_06585 [Pseudomonadota bacterium]|nr:hypothetical protein [Pseudomonadota bacterium]
MLTVMAATIFTATRAPEAPRTEPRPAPRKSMWALRNAFRLRLGARGCGKSRT